MCCLLIAVLLLLSCPSPAQTLRNGDFSQGCDTCATKAAFWDISWAGKGVLCERKMGGLRIACTDSVDQVGFVEQALRIAPVKEPVIFAVGAVVDPENLRGKGASLNIACYDAEGGFLMNKDMGLFPSSWIHGSGANKRYTLKLVLPEGTATIKVGAIVNGRGEAWFSHFTTALLPLEGRTPDRSAAAYVQAAFDTIVTHALYIDSVDLEGLRTTALRIAGPNGDRSEHWLAVEFLLHALGDHHSFLMTPETYTAWKNESGEGGTEITHASHRIIDGYGYVSVPGFPSGDSLAVLAFSDSLQRALEQLDRSGVKGWIVDLRQNTGGNMAPMIAGLGPLFDPGVLGGLTDRRGRTERWSYRDGVYGWDGEAAVRVTRPVALQRKLPIAVLTSQQTGSSGECTTISFIGNSRTRSFGQPTWGLTTGNGEFELPDGARMFMASTIMGDRSGRLFHGPITPDESVEQTEDGNVDAVLDAALKWLAKQ